MTLHVVCDISGSMSEGGKPFIVRTVAMSIAQWVRFGYARTEIKLYGWASEVDYFSNWSTKDEFPAKLLTCSDTSNATALAQSLGKNVEGKVLLLTDGFWSREEEKLLKCWKDSLPLDSLRIIKIGADANPRCKGADIFAAEDLFTALDGWLQISEEWV